MILAKNFSICILANNEISKNIKYVKQIYEFFNDKDISCCVAETSKDEFENYIFTNIPKDAKLLIALGGDGTMLSAARNAIQNNIPFFGFNTGTLGFLCENKASKINEVLNNLMNKKCHIEERMMVKAYKDEKFLGIALNDIIIAREGFSRIVSMETSIDGSILNKYKGDGLIVSTPTGSTGYNLSLGGPIVSPKASNLILTPIACHTLLARPIILSSEEEIDIHILRSRKTQEKEAILTIDGRRNIDLHSGDKIHIKASKLKAKFLKFDGDDFFTICNKKLK